MYDAIIVIVLLNPNSPINNKLICLFATFEKVYSMNIIAIIPAYNEESNIVAVVENFISVCPEYDYVIINDGGHDKTLDICRKRGYNVVSLPINLGLSGAFQTGMKYAYRYGYDAAVQIDADGQHLPEYINAMADKIANGNDIVIGSRFIDTHKKHSLRMLGSELISFAILITTGKKIADPTSGMRMYNRNMIKEFARERNHDPEPDTLCYLIRRGLRLTEVPVKMQERLGGNSYFNLKSSAIYMFQMCLSILVIQWFRGGSKIQHDNDIGAESSKN